MVNCIGLRFHPNLLKRRIWKVTWNCVQKTKKKTVTSIIVVSIFSRRLTCCGTPSWVLPFILTSFTCWVNVFSILIKQNKMRISENQNSTISITWNKEHQTVPIPYLSSWCIQCAPIVGEVVELAYFKPIIFGKIGKVLIIHSAHNVSFALLVVECA